MGLSPMHLILILGVVLLLFGPSRLPGLGKGIGEAIRGFKKGIRGDEIDVTPKEQLSASQQDDEITKAKARSKQNQD